MINPSERRCHPLVQSLSLLYPEKSAEAKRATNETESMADLAVVAEMGSNHKEHNEHKTNAASGITAPRKNFSAKFAGSTDSLMTSDDGKLPSTNRQLRLPKRKGKDS